ncbi:MAG TPA: nucleotidyltransferase domain-containing protein [Gemmatimonadales bacterium]
MPPPAPPAVTLALSPEAAARLDAIARRHGIRLLLAFGSRVSGRPHPASDLDLAVLLDVPGRDDPLGLLADLQAVFPACAVDVLWLHRADPLIGWHALRAPRLLYGNAADLARRQAYAWRRLVEYEPFFALEAEAVRRGIARLARVG